MKSLSLSRPLVITVIGLPGSGKSFFARQFAEMFGAPLVSHDFIRHSIFSKMHFTPEEDSLVGTVGSGQISELLKTGKTIIVDGGMNSRSARLLLDRQTKAYGYGRLTVWVQTDEPTSRVRSLKRSANRAGDALNQPLDEATFKRYARQFAAPTVSENVIVISGKHTFASQAKVVLRKLVTPRDVVTTLARPQGSPAPGSDVKPENHTDVQPRRRNVIIG